MNWKATNGKSGDLHTAKELLYCHWDLDVVSMRVLYMGAECSAQRQLVDCRFYYLGGRNGHIFFLISTPDLKLSLKMMLTTCAVVILSEYNEEFNKWRPGTMNTRECQTHTRCTTYVVHQDLQS